MNDSEFEKDSCDFTRVSPLKKTILSQLASINDFHYFLGRRVCCTQAMKKICSLEFIHTVFLTKREAIYKIPIKPCVRNLIQHCSVQKHQAYRDMDDSEVEKILVS